MALTSRVIVPDLGPEAEAEDIYAIHLAYLFTDHIPNAHGDPGTSIAYKSPLFGDISLKIPKHPDIDSDRQLFAHYLWNSAIIAAEAIESASANNEANKSRVADKELPWQQCEWDSSYWDMRDADVLELGAGTGLPSIISYLSGARSLTTTDHPSSTSVTTNIIAANISQNVLKEKATRSPSPSHDNKTQQSPDLILPPNAKVYGYLWGTKTFCQRPSTSSSSNPSPLTSSHQYTDIPLEPVAVQQQPNLHSFTKIIVADCLWIPSKHSAICRTILDYLANSIPSQHPIGSDDSAHQSKQPCALVIAGFHTGRAITSDFFALATGSDLHSDDRVQGDSEVVDDDDALTVEVRGQLKIAEIFEVDVKGRRREWMAHRPGESREDTKRWCVCAALVQR